MFPWSFELPLSCKPHPGCLASVAYQHAPMIAQRLGRSCDGLPCSALTLMICAAVQCATLPAQCQGFSACPALICEEGPEAQDTGYTCCRCVLPLA